MAEAYPRSTQNMHRLTMIRRLNLVNRALDQELLTNQESEEIEAIGWIDNDDARDIENHPSIKAVQDAIVKLGRSEALVKQSRLLEWQIVLDHAINDVAPSPESIHDIATPDDTAA